jgi:hypothetical protein
VRSYVKSEKLLEYTRLHWAGWYLLKLARSSRKVKVKSKRLSISAIWRVVCQEVSMDRSSHPREKTIS